MTWNTHMLRINILFPCSTVSWHIGMLVCSQPSTSYLRTKQIDNCSLAAYYWLLSYKTLFTLCDSVIHPKQRLKSFGNCVVNGVEERPSNESFHLNLKFQLVLLSVNRHTLTLKFPKNEAFHLEFHMVFFSLPFFEKKKTSWIFTLPCHLEGHKTCSLFERSNNEHKLFLRCSKRSAWIWINKREGDGERDKVIMSN